jgi:hypothetical protein
MQREGGLVKRAIVLATAALLAMLILAQMALAQQGGHDVFGATIGGTTVFAGSGGSPVAIPDGGGPSILLPAVALLLGSGILTYAILRRR